MRIPLRRVHPHQPLPRRLLPSILGALVLGTWWLASETAWAGSPLVPSPARLATALWAVAEDGRLWEGVAATAEEIGLAVLLFVAVGTAVGLTMGGGPLRFNVVYGPLSTLFALPKVTLLPLFVLMFGYGTQQKVLFGALYGLFPLVMNTMVGARAVSAVHRDLFDSVGAGPLFRALRLTLPSMMPFFLSGLRIGFVYAGIGVLLAEMYVSTKGLGQEIVSAADQTTLDQFWVFVGAATVILVAGSTLLRALEERVTWRP